MLDIQIKNIEWTFFISPFHMKILESKDSKLTGWSIFYSCICLFHIIRINNNLKLNA